MAAYRFYRHALRKLPSTENTFLGIPSQQSNLPTYQQSIVHLQIVVNSHKIEILEHHN